MQIGSKQGARTLGGPGVLAPSPHRLCVALLLTITTNISYGADLPVLNSTGERRIQMYGAPEFYQLTSGSSTLRGVGGSAGVQYAAADAWAFGTKLEQGFSRRGRWTALYTEIALTTQYALTGSLRRQGESLNAGQHKIFEYTPQSTGGWRVDANFGELFLNLPTNVLSLSGAGFGLSYEIPVQGSIGMSFGAMGVLASNGEVSMRVLQGAARVFVWL